MTNGMRAYFMAVCLLLGGCTFNTSGLTSRDVPRVDHSALDGPANLSDGPRDDGPIADRVLTDLRLDRALSDAEQPRSDAPTLDQPHGDQPKPDTSLPDQPKPDAKKPDASLPDQPKPDAKKPDGSPPSCLALFQNKGIPGFFFCSETATTCVFYYDPASSDNCTNMCAKGGKGCIKSAEDSSNGCATSIDRDCAFEHGDGVCTCKR